MVQPTSPSPMTVPKFIAAKSQSRKLSVITAYDFLWAKLFDEAGVDALLVGDSLAMVVQGKSTTLPVTMDEIVYHAEIVCRAVKRALVIVDLPYLSFHISPQQAIENAGRIFKETGAAAVKLESGVHQAETIRALATAEIPVMAHVGMRPQSVRRLGSMGKIQRNEELLLAEAKAAEEAGAFGIVLELVPRSIAARITKEVSIPTIGIGAGPECDGQVLVCYDMLGLNEGFQPKYLKRYADLAGITKDAVRNYVADVAAGRYPDAAHSHE